MRSKLRVLSAAQSVSLLLVLALVAPACSTPGGDLDSSRVEPLLPADVEVGLNGFEPHAVVSPVDPEVVAVAVFRSVRLSFDGGKSFEVEVPGRVPSTHGAGGGDPVLAFDREGRLYFTYLARRANVNDDGFGRFDVFVQQVDARRSGFAVASRTLDAEGNDCETPAADPDECPVNVTRQIGLDARNDVTPDGRSHDRQWLAVDARPPCPSPTPPHNTRTCSPHSGNLYVVWTDLGPGLVVRASSSDARGANGSWVAAELSLPEEGFAQQTHMAIAANGDVWAAYHAQPGFTNNQPNGISGQIVTLVSTTGSASGFGDRTTPFPPGQADITFNRQQCPCGAGTCSADPAQVCTFLATACPGEGCECGEGDTCVPPAGCANTPLPGWQPCSRKMPESQSLLQGSATPYVVPNPTNPNQLAVFASADPDVSVLGDDFDVRMVTTTNATDAVPLWSSPQSILPEGMAMPDTNQIFPTAAAATNGPCVSLMYYDDRNTGLSVNGNSLLDVFVTVNPNPWAGAPWGREVQMNDAPFDPDIGNVGADFHSFCGGAEGCTEPAGWVVTNRMGEYNGLIHADGVAFVANEPLGTPQYILFDYADGVEPVVSAPVAVTVTTCRPRETTLGTATATDTCGKPPLSSVRSNFQTSLGGFLRRGSNQVTWSASDGAENPGEAIQEVVVDDRTPPRIHAPADVHKSSCGRTRVHVGAARAFDDCKGPVTIRGSVVSTNGRRLHRPLPVENGYALLGFGRHVVVWTASDGITSSQVTQIVEVQRRSHRDCSRGRRDHDGSWGRH